MSPHVPIAVAAAIAEVKPATIRQWVHRGKIIRYRDGFSIEELLALVDRQK